MSTGVRQWRLPLLRSRKKGNVRCSHVRFNRSRYDPCTCGSLTGIGCTAGISATPNRYLMFMKAVHFVIRTFRKECVPPSTLRRAVALICTIVEASEGSRPHLYDHRSRSRSALPGALRFCAFEVTTANKKKS